MCINVVVTMAGRGRRFAEAGYKVPKYEIRARGRSLFEWSMSSLANFLTRESRLVFVCLSENNAGGFLRKNLPWLSLSDARILELEAVTDGQATSAYRSRDLWRLDAPLLIYNIDTHISPDRLSPALIRAGSDGWVPCAPLAGDHWSFVALGEAGWAVAVAEKERISNYASLGLYWFASARDFLEAYEHVESNAWASADGERYVAPLYGRLIQRGGRVSISVLPPSCVDVLGTPAELDAFVQKGSTWRSRGWGEFGGQSEA